MARPAPTTALIYSLGATLYSALTDALPEDGLARAMEQADLTSLLSHNPKVSRRIAGVLEKCLEVRPDNRYQNADELKTDLLNAQTTTRRKLPIELVLPPPPVVLGQNMPSGTDDCRRWRDAGRRSLLAAHQHPLANADGWNGSAPRGGQIRPKRKRRSGMESFPPPVLAAGALRRHVINPALPGW
jgi:serine/threonine protein kinase